MSFTISKDQILVAGCQESMFTIDVEKGQLLEMVITHAFALRAWLTRGQIPTEWNYTLMRKSRYVCAATDNGSVNVLDANSFQVLKS